LFSLETSRESIATLGSARGDAATPLPTFYEIVMR